MAKRIQDKYNYRSLVLGRRERKAWMEDLATIRTPKLQRICNAFALNTARARVLAIAFAETAYLVRRDQWCMDQAWHKATGKIESPFVDSPPNPAVMAEFSKQVSRWNSMAEENRNSLLDHFGVRSIRGMIETVTGMDVTIEAVMSSVIIESWTAFETMVADLWVTAVDYGPAILRKRVLLKTVKAENDNDPVDSSAEEMEFDPARRLGSALRQARKVSFQKLALISRNYQTAFTPKIKSVFGHANGYIAVLAAYRNALIHNGGKADATFKKQVEGFKEFDGIKKNRKLALEGQLVAKLRDVSTTVGSKLLHFVDDVLTPP